jgi:hypothetical protein
MVQTQTAHDHIVDRLQRSPAVHGLAVGATPLSAPPPRVRTHVVASTEQLTTGQFRNASRRPPLDPASVTMETEHRNRSAWTEKSGAQGLEIIKNIQPRDAPKRETKKRVRASTRAPSAPVKRSLATHLARWAPAPAPAPSGDNFLRLEPAVRAHLMGFVSARDATVLDMRSPRAILTRLGRMIGRRLLERPRVLAPPPPRCARINAATEERCPVLLESTSYQSALFCCYECEAADRVRRAVWVARVSAPARRLAP